MTVFASDLDNTLIYSFRHDIGSEKKCVEINHSREFSFITQNSYRLLKKLCAEWNFVPVTSRSIEQYKRIDFGIGGIKYALVCNGGILLENGKKNSLWQEETMRLINPCRTEIDKGFSLLKDDKNRKSEINFIENMFVFTKCENPQSVAEFLKSKLDNNLLDVLCNGEKIYIFPKKLSKGFAIERLKSYLKIDKIISAGDSVTDVSMIEKADVAIVPSDFRWKIKNPSGVILKNTEQTFFSDFVLQKALECLSHGL